MLNFLSTKQTNITSSNTVWHYLKTFVSTCVVITVELLDDNYAASLTYQKRQEEMD